jgi:hypothetical protein
MSQSVTREIPGQRLFVVESVSGAGVMSKRRGVCGRAALSSKKMNAMTPGRQGKKFRRYNVQAIIKTTIWRDAP